MLGVGAQQERLGAAGDLTAAARRAHTHAVLCFPPSVFVDERVLRVLEGKKAEQTEFDMLPFHQSVRALKDQVWYRVWLLGRNRRSVPNLPNEIIKFKKLTCAPR